MDPLTVLTALAALAGFAMEWRRSGRDHERADDHGRRIADVERHLADLQAWRDRMGRAQ